MHTSDILALVCRVTVCYPQHAWLGTEGIDATTRRVRHTVHLSPPGLDSGVPTNTGYTIDELAGANRAPAAIAVLRTLQLLDPPLVITTSLVAVQCALCANTKMLSDISALCVANIGLLCGHCSGASQDGPFSLDTQYDAHAHDVLMDAACHALDDDTDAVDVRWLA